MTLFRSNVNDIEDIVSYRGSLIADSHFKFKSCNMKTCSTAASVRRRKDCFDEDDELTTTMMTMPLARGGY